MDNFLWGGDPYGYHLTNVILHILNVVLVFCIAQRLFLNSYSSYFAALLFGIHPVNTSCVSYIAGRADVLTASFILLALIFYMDYSQKGKISSLLISVTAYICAIFAKEYAILVLPLLVFLYNAVFKKEHIGKIYIYLSYFAVLALYLPLRLHALSGLTPYNLELYHIGMLPRVFTSLKTLFIDIRILLVPFDLHFARTTTVENSIFSSPYATLTALGLVATGCFLGYLYKKYKHENDITCGMIFFGISWFFLSMAPLLNIMPLQVFHSENWLYLSSIGIYLAAVSVISAGLRICINRNAPVFRNVILLIISFVLLCYGYTTFKRNQDYGDTVRFYLSNLKWRPNVKFYRVLSGIYGSKNDLDNAIKYSRKAIEVNEIYPSPEVAGAYYNMGLTYMNLRKYREAKEAFLKVMIFNDEGLKKSALAYLNSIENKK
ncbi:MAG: tetratricopeptide repeat protein [Candidatus Omnitrophica bacterium]|nr:tetratricopeptide repeat protein [Candidatus Omnitrophota bacterium]